MDIKISSEGINCITKTAGTINITTLPMVHRVIYVPEFATKIEYLFLSCIGELSIIFSL